jgi:hypothetical protein
MIRSMRRTTSSLLALSVTAMLLAGCGSSTHVSSTSPPTRAPKPISSAQAVAYANAVNLRAADVPGLQAALHKPRAETANGPFGAAMDRCQSAAVRAGDVFAISSQRFVHLSLPLQSVGSGVYYFNSETLAHEYLATASTPRFAACVKTLAADEPKTVTREGSKVAEPMFSRPRLLPLPVSLPGVQTYGLRLAVRSPLGRRGSVGSYTDFLSFVTGDAVITLTAVGQGRPFPAAGEQRLLALLHDRAEAHKA